MGKSERDRERYLRETALNKRLERYRQMEKRLLGEWSKQVLAQGYETYYHQPLGPLLPSQLERTVDVKDMKLLDVYRPYCDLLAIGERDVLIVECAIRFKSDHVGKLLGYGHLFRLTPDFADVQDLPLRLIAVAAMYDSLSFFMCQHYGIEPFMFRPWWLEEYLRSLEFRKQRPNRQMLHYLPTIGSKTPLEYSI